MQLVSVFELSPVRLRVDVTFLSGHQDSSSLCRYGSPESCLQFLFLLCLSFISSLFQASFLLFLCFIFCSSPSFLVQASFLVSDNQSFLLFLLILSAVIFLPGQLLPGGLKTRTARTSRDLAIFDNGCMFVAPRHFYQPGFINDSTIR
jgi:hypothetical protein